MPDYIEFLYSSNLSSQCTEHQFRVCELGKLYLALMLAFFFQQSKIVRVLNLWQKNGVFKIEIIQPLLDMAAGTSATAPMTENATNNEGMNDIITYSSFKRVNDNSLFASTLKRLQLVSSVAY